MSKNITTKKQRKNNLPATIVVSDDAADPPTVPAPSANLARSIGVDPAALAEIVKTVILEFADALPQPTDPELAEAARTRRGRQDAVRLRQRMHEFRAIYNAAWFIRYAENQETEYRKEKMRAFWNLCLKELADCRDIEAFTYAVADSLTAHRFGFPWEG